jgi:Flp pilus assembly protein CpaB
MFNPFKRNSRRGVPAAARSGGRGGRSLNLTLLLGGVAIVGTFALVFYILLGLNKQYTYFVAIREVPAGAVLESTDITAMTGSGNPIGSNVIIGTDEMNAHLGQLVTRELLVGDVIQYSTLFWQADNSSNNPADPNAGQHYAYRFTQLIPANDRGVVITGDPTTTYVRAGDYVDIYYADATSVRRMFEAQVLYAIPQVDPASGAAAGQVGVPTGTSFVLNLTPQQAQDLVWAQQNGTIRVALAPPDVTGGSTTQVTNQTYFDQTYGVSAVGSPGPVSSGASLPQVSGTTPVPSQGVPGLPSPAASK